MLRNQIDFFMGPRLAECTKKKTFLEYFRLQGKARKPRIAVRLARIWRWEILAGGASKV